MTRLCSITSVMRSWEFVSRGHSKQGPNTMARLDKLIRLSASNSFTLVEEGIYFYSNNKQIMEVP